MSSIKNTIQHVLSNHQGISRDEVFNYIKYQNLCPDESIDKVTINQLLDNLIMNSIVEKKLINEKYLYYLIKPVSDTNQQEENGSDTTSNMDLPPHPGYPHCGHPDSDHPYQPVESNDKQETSYNGEEVFGDVTTKSVKKMVYTDSWKDCAGRESGSDGYQFGDVSRTVLKSLFATS